MTGIELAVARGRRGRREGLALARAEIARELRGAPLNAPGRTQLTYDGGLARARRILERLYHDAAAVEEQLVVAGADEALFDKALKAAWDALPDGSMDDITPDTLAVALRAAAAVYDEANGIGA